MSLAITTARPESALLDLPWSTPLEDWPESVLAALPRGISRHVVRFVRLGSRVLAVKEIKSELADREYVMLRNLRRLDVPSVEPFGVVHGRVAADGTPLDSCLVTRHLQYSLPYRALYSQSLRPDTAVRLMDALALLLVRLHLEGFWWGDVSLSNTLFRRDAGAFAAYLVDAETGELHQHLSDGQRQHDLDIAQVNIAGELMDLEAGGFLEEQADPFEVASSVIERYHSLWEALTGTQRFEAGDRWRVDERIRQLNELGFDVDELSITTDIGGTQIQITPKVVDAGHHSRRLLRLTGLDVGENQARRLLNDLDAYAAATDRQGDDEEIVAHEWLAKVYEPVTRAVPRELTGRLEPAEIFHEVLEHRWYLSERAGHDMPIEEALADYVATVLPGKPIEKSVVGVDTVEMPVIAWDD
ncbi:DUF4032 domain-containing protein [Intrasporangium calvum]|uniref:DUF4032 domain-containing protein n=1 Tax=Intrasporangium calvum (strain ATCC 23552 / DSM 43043 / JCM 3097 / NBRC 12989 / NCIMB 10167 / NRRL B-3866 / 7 KIP) TaxID=710696 RepID=E6SAV2_INTC7|nr:DUF4032 domain-containing protein [Intrasporangium calvum]ADU49413.1 hypothetical protein Intca_2918 [Intrasporangium calvum DSM 43043]